MTTHHPNPSYTYTEAKTHGKGWHLAQADGTGPEIQRNDETGSFKTDAEAALHVLYVAAFDTTAEGEHARAALRKMVDFGAKGLNPIATKIGL